jgi:dTDP-4-amino-4,6-dideoxygalactose transaminase
VESYNRAFADVPEFELPPDKDDCRHAWHLYMLRLNLDRIEISRDEFIVELNKRGIGVSVHFIPISLHPFFAPFAERPENQCPRAMALYPRLISLPLYPAMTDAQVEYVAESAKTIARQARSCKPAFLSAAGD